MIILLNGASSSGKSSIAKAIQYLDHKPWLVLGIDTMISMMPSKYWVGGEKADEGFNFVSDNDEHGPIMSIRVGKFGNRISEALREIVSLLTRKEFNIIIDEILLGDESLKKYVKTFKNSIVYFVGIYCDKEILEEREILRGDRFIGSGRDQMNRCHGPNRKYDLEVNTSNHSPFASAKQILAFIDKEKNPQGFKQLNEMFK